MNFLNKYMDQIKSLCAANEVNSLFAFGSVTGSGFNPASDVDLVVDIYSSNPLDYADHYFSLKFSLEQLFKRPVDLLEQKSIKNPFIKQEIETTKVLIYGR